MISSMNIFLCSTVLPTLTLFSQYHSTNGAFQLHSPTFIPRPTCQIPPHQTKESSLSNTCLYQSSSQVATPPVETTSFIDTELRDAAMKLHTRSQAPKEGQAAEPQRPKEPHVTTHADYLRYLIDSQHVFQALEDVVNVIPEMTPFRNTGLERTKGLEVDIEFMLKEYGLGERPSVGRFGEGYAQLIREIGERGNVPELMCHYYNFYFAHTAGGLMIGKSMSKLLLGGKTLEFYKWEGNIAEIKKTVKADIEKMASSWTREEKDQCVSGTGAAFGGGGGINSYLKGAEP